MRAPKGSQLKKALKKANIIYSIIFLLAVAMWVLYGVVTTFFIFPAIVLSIYWLTLPSLKKKIKRQHCRHCGQKYHYDDIGWQVEEEINSGNKLDEVVAFECSCANCGEVSSFTKKFTVAIIDKNGNIKRKNLESEIKKYIVEE